MKKTLTALFIFICLVLLVGCTKQTETKVVTVETDNPLINNSVKMKLFEYSDVTLLDGIYKDVYDNTLAYYLSLTPDDLLFGMRKKLSMDTKTGRDLSLGVGGNVMGQMMSAAARYAVALGTDEAMARAKEFCDGLYEINQQSAYFLDGYYMYTFEKYLTGCLDFYNYCGFEKGLEMAERMVDWAMSNNTYVNAAKLLGNNGPGTEIEWYTIPEALYNFAETMRMSGASVSDVKQYREFAKSFLYTEFWNIFYNDENIFDYSPQAGQNTRYFHAYSHLNSFNSAAKAYMITNDSYYLDCINKFYKWFCEEEKMLSGGYGAHTEWFSPREEIIDFIRSYHDNYETQCDTYAAFRLSNYMTQFNGTTNGDWMEKLLYNAVISSLETEDGYAFYYSDYNTTGAHKTKIYSWRWSCCSGSRPLIINEVLKSIYYNDTKNLYVSQFINSEVKFKNAAGDDIVLRQETDMPNEGKTTLTLKSSPEKEYSIKYRIPSYAKNLVITVNGEKVGFAMDSLGWGTIKRVWKTGDKIEISFDIPLEVSTFEVETEYGDDGIFLINYGPVILCAEMSPGVRPQSFMSYNSNANELVVKGKDNLHYVSKMRDDINFKPYYEFKEDEYYFMYFNMYF